MRFSGGSEPQSLRDSAEGKSSTLYLNHLEHLCIVRFFYWFGLEEIHDIPLVTWEPVTWVQLSAKCLKN